NGLEGSEVDFRVVARRSAAEDQQETEKAKRTEQRNVAPSRETADIEPGQRGQGHEERPRKHAKGKLVKLEGVAERVAHADHEEEPEAGEQLERGKEEWITAEITESPEKRDQVESTEKEQCRFD